MESGELGLATPIHLNPDLASQGIARPFPGEVRASPGEPIFFPISTYCDGHRPSRPRCWHHAAAGFIGNLVSLPVGRGTRFFLIFLLFAEDAAFQFDVHHDGFMSVIATYFDVNHILELTL